MTHESQEKIDWPPVPEIPPKWAYSLYRTEIHCAFGLAATSVILTVAWVAVDDFALSMGVIVPCWGMTMHYAWQALMTRRIIRDGEALHGKIMAERATLLGR